MKSVHIWYLQCYEMLHRKMIGNQLLDKIKLEVMHMRGKSYVIKRFY